MTFHGSGTIVFGSLLGVPSLGMHLAMSVALEFFEAASADLDCRPQRPFDGDFRVSTLPFDRVLTQIQTATTQTLTKVRSRAQRLFVSIGRMAAVGRFLSDYQLAHGGTCQSTDSNRFSKRVSTCQPDKCARAICIVRVRAAFNSHIGHAAPEIDRVRSGTLCGINLTMAKRKDFRSTRELLPDEVFATGNRVATN